MLIRDKNDQSPAGEVTSIKRYDDPAITIVVSQDVAEIVESGEDIINNLDHGSLSGLGDDDHPQYLNEDRHDVLDLLRDPVADWYDPTGGLPVGPSVGDRYISDATANGWEIDHIYEWDGSNWIEEEPAEGWMVYMILEFMFYFFFSGGWIEADTKVSVDADATPGYLGAASSDGVLRTDSTMRYTDGGDYITLGINRARAYLYSGF